MAKHRETHFTASDFIRDVVIGMSDGLTVPFALAAGLSGAVSSNALVVTAGLAEIAAGSIAMGLGGFLAARTEREHYFAELERERREVVEFPQKEREEVRQVLLDWGLEAPEAEKVVSTMAQEPKRWVDFMMKHELELNEPDPRRARNSSLTIGASYIVGGLIPLLPYMILPGPSGALLASVVFTLVALLLFGFIKGSFTGNRPLASSLQTAGVGGVAAAVAYAIAGWIA